MARRKRARMPKRVGQPAVIATGVLRPPSRDGTVLVGYEFHRDAAGVIRLSMRVNPRARFSREAWITIWTMLKADFKELSQIGKRKGPRRRGRGRYVIRSRRRFVVRPNPPKVKVKAIQPHITSSTGPSDDLVALATEKLAAR
jgi:hypothetical protein